MSVEKGGLQRIGPGLRLQLVGRALRDDGPVVDDRDALRHAIRFVHVVRREEHRHLLRLVQIPDLRPELVPALGVEAEGRLVEEDDLRRVQEAARDLEPPSHAAGELLHQRVAAIPELEEPQQPLAALEPDLAGHVVEQRVHLHVLPRGQVAVEARILEDDAELRPGGVRVRRRIQPVEPHRAARRPEQRRHHLDRGGLPGAVRTEEGEDLAAADFERHALDRLDVAEGLAEIGDGNHGGASQN